MNIAILILAAGSSTRMGSIKQLLPAGHTTLLGISIENAIHSNATKVYCVLGAHSKDITESIKNYDVEIILNPNYVSGLSSSIVAGIQHLSNKNFDAVVLLLGDQPFVTTKYINTMIATYKKNPNKIIASTYNQTFGVPAIILKRNFNALLTLKGDKGAKAFLNNNSQDIISLDNADLLDIDTLEDYLELLKSENIR